MQPLVSRWPERPAADYSAADATGRRLLLVWSRLAVVKDVKYGRSGLGFVEALRAAFHRTDAPHRGCLQVTTAAAARKL